MPLEAVGEQQQEDAGAQRQRGGERAERAGQDLGEGVHPAVAETGEDTGGDVDQSDGGAGPADQGGHGLGAGTAQQPAYPGPEEPRARTAPRRVRTPFRRTRTALRWIRMASRRIRMPGRRIRTASRRVCARRTGDLVGRGCPRGPLRAIRNRSRFIPI
ncbi:hypothetical protein GCM10009654_32000 [Streptomyces hebeiensis]|uniref:Uncharacterized protein n=1 Tax=Streptomyces hebeiensis TaxID=229486 RepID=A0ABP4FHL5_9ACTN